MGKDEKSDDEYSFMGDKGDIGFIDLQECSSVCSYNPAKESESFSISVPFPLVNGKPQLGLVGRTTSASVTIQNNTDEYLDLWSVKIYDSKPEDCFTISLKEPPNENSDEEYIQEFMEMFSLEEKVLQPGQTLTIWLSCKPTVIGLHSSAVHFTIGDDTIERLCFVMAENKLSQSFASQKPFYKTKKNRHSGGAYCSKSFVVGSRPSKNSKDGGYKNRLPEYRIPKEIITLLDQKQIPDVINEGLSMDNYASFFKTLLNMEEIKMEEDMRDYDMESAMMTKRGSQLLSMEVLGLAERRPSLVIGDFILAKYAHEYTENTRAYQKDAHYGSWRSYLERLFECQLYADGNENYITRLVRNYRAHPSILYLSSNLFYDGQLISCKKSAHVTSQPPWLDLLPNPDFPIVFMGVQGFDEREGSNPSWFNMIEANLNKVYWDFKLKTHLTKAEVELQKFVITYINILSMYIKAIT